MKGDPKLRLVLGGLSSPGKRPDEPGEEPPFDEEEAAAAEATRARLDLGDDLLASALSAAWSPPPLDAAAHDALIAQALESDLALADRSSAPPSPDELRCAEALRSALEGAPASGDEAAELAGALQAAYRPRELAALRNELLIARALGAAKKPPRRGALFAVTGALALAASVALVVRALAPAAPDASLAAAPELIQARSTVALFDPSEPFPRSGGSSERIDRIARARAADLRENRFAAWGVR